MTEIMVMPCSFVYYIDSDILDVNGMRQADAERTQRNARHVGGSCLVGAREGISRPGGSCWEELELEPDRPRRLGFPCAGGPAPQGTVAGQYDWSESMAYAGIDQCGGRSAGGGSACETGEYRRPARAPGRTHGAGTPPPHHNLSGTRRHDGA